MVKVIAPHRDKPEIYASILRSASASYETGLTRLMYDSYLSYMQLKRNLIEMVQSNLLIYEVDSNRYRVTEKGLKFLALMDKMNDILKIENWN